MGQLVIQSAPNTPAQPRRQLLRAPKGEAPLHAAFTWRKSASGTHASPVSLAQGRIWSARRMLLKILLSQGQARSVRTVVKDA